MKILKNIFSNKKQKIQIYILVIGLILVFIPLVTQNNYWLRIYSMTGIYVMLAMGLNVVAGFAGLLDLSYVAFFGIGAYTFALLSSDQFSIHIPFLLSLPISACLSMGFGFILGSTSSRLKGDYLAIVTLAFSQIFKIFLINLDQPVNITGGVNGIYNFDPITIFGIKVITPIAYSYLIWFFAIFTIIMCRRLKKSRLGRGWEAIREDELAAESMGINTTWMKLLAFASGAFIAGGTGAIFASFQDSVFPNSFDFPQLVIIYCMVILGGLGNILGIVISAVLLSILPEFLREYGAYRMMFYGMILILLMALRPQGIMGEIVFFKKRKKRPDKDETGVLRKSTDLYYTDTVSKNNINKLNHSKGSEIILKVKGITMDFGGIRAIDNCNFHLYEKEVLSIIGPNGAGKTTLFNIISGIYTPTEGSILFKGKNISGLKPHKIVRAGIARTFQNLRLFNNMTILDNAKVGQFCRTKSNILSILLHLPIYKRDESQTHNRAQEILKLFGKRITGYRYGQHAHNLSYANRRRLEIARAMATDAKILLLDEPSAGMNPQETLEITDFIKILRDQYGYTILVIEHKLNLVQSISDRVIVMDYGKEIAQGSFQEITNNKKVIQAYLGRK